MPSPSNHINPGLWRIPHHDNVLIHPCHKLRVRLRPSSSSTAAPMSVRQAFGGCSSSMALSKPLRGAVSDSRVPTIILAKRSLRF